MPGASLATPMVLCPGDGAMPGMAMPFGAAHHRGQAPHDALDHQCAFAGLTTTAVTPDLTTPMLAPFGPAIASPDPNRPVAVPGRGLAAPPPPSHAPPAFRA